MTRDEIIRRATAITDDVRRRFPDYAPRLAGLTIKVGRAVRRAGSMKIWPDHVDIAPVMTLSGTIFGKAENEHGFENTVLHELAHAIAPFGTHHGPAWVRIAREIGCDGKRCHRYKTDCAEVACDRCGKTMRLGPTQAKRNASYQRQHGKNLYVCCRLPERPNPKRKHALLDLGIDFGN